MATLQLQTAFDDMGGRFQARLKGTRTVSKQVQGGQYEATSSFAVLEAKFDLEVFDRLHDPTFIAIERSTTDGPIYLVYEVTSLYPMHFQMLGVSSSIPQQIREEFLERVSEGWGESQETWIDLYAVSTGYRLADGGDEMKFERCRLTPLQGSVAHRLSKAAVERLLCVEGGLELGKVKGQDIRLTVDADSLLGYHIGVFGFTGVGKSNLTANLIRKMMDRDPELKVCVLDISGEYPVHLVDKLGSGMVYTTEDFSNKAEIFTHSQVIPSTLEKELKDDAWLLGIFQRLLADGRIKVLSMEQSASSFTLGSVYEALADVIGERKAGYQMIEVARSEIVARFSKAGFSADSELKRLPPEEVDFLIGRLESLKGKVHEKSSAVKAFDSLIELLRMPEPEEGVTLDTPEETAYRFLTGKDRLYIFYAPNPSGARDLASRYLSRLLYLKKVLGLRQRVLVVLDEAQEFAPQDAKGEEGKSSRAVEALLRQGRKYRAYAVISTQRVAHMNTNALQQLHSYFVSTLPRVYDRLVIADSFSLDLSVLERTAELQTGEWLFLSYKATQQKNVPVFIETENNEETVKRHVLGGA
ncbi:MAG: ATP-binding protein [Nitrososphaerota archaeon]|nr:ATP-binding protein [Nitrososphaerota archaeon]